ncbi:MAG TPA: hypothetical protein VMK84_14420 [Streptosporangiaceae bacterium]|nr:hypothetical protein [Streptosporangiaceae bacterium]
MLIDHLVYAAPSLPAAVADVAERYRLARENALIGLPGIAQRA